MGKRLKKNKIKVPTPRSGLPYADRDTLLPLCDTFLVYARSVAATRSPFSLK